MDTARDKRTKQSTTGFDLKRLETVDKSGYECIACGIPVNPVSFEKHHKRSPHFKLFPKTEHLSNCGYEKEQNSYINAETERISTPDGLSFPYPSRMVLPRDTIFDNSPNSRNLDETNFVSKVRTENSEHNSSRPHNYTVDTIRSLAQFYLRFPFDRHLALSVPGIVGSNFNGIFQKIAYEDARDYSEKKILFGSLHYQSTITGEDSVEIKLTQGYWKEKKPLNQYRVRIDTKGWTELEKNALVSEVNIIRDEIKEINDKDKNRNKKNEKWNEKIKGWLFFVGEQDAKDEFLFHANNWRFICCVAGNFRQGNTPKTRKVEQIENASQAFNKVESSNYTLIVPPAPVVVKEQNGLTNNPLGLPHRTANDFALPPIKSFEERRPEPKFDSPAKKVAPSTKPASVQNTAKRKATEKSLIGKFTSRVSGLWGKLFG